MQGQSLFDIAIDLNLDPNELADLNRALDPEFVANQIVYGESIKLPCSGEPGLSASYRITDNPDWQIVEQTFDGYVMVLVPTGCFLWEAVLNLTNSLSRPSVLTVLSGLANTK